jgi:hypothetical protein
MKTCDRTTQLTLQDLPPSLVGVPPLLASPAPSNLSYHAATVAFQRALLRQVLARAIIRGGRPGPGAAAHLLAPLAQLPQPPLTPLGYTLYPKGYRPHELCAGRPPAPGWLPHAARVRSCPPQTHPAAPARRCPVASHGAAAAAGMALAKTPDRQEGSICKARPGVRG